MMLVQTVDFFYQSKVCRHRGGSDKTLGNLQTLSWIIN